MNVSSDINERVAAIVDEAGRAQGIEAVEVKLAGSGAKRVLRIYIDKPQGVTHADCEFISDTVGAVLDAEDVIPGPGYTLEVSSPGVERRLVRPKDFERFTGKKIKIVLREPSAGSKLWEGTLAAFHDGLVTLQPAHGSAVEFPLEQVDKANLKFDW